MWEIATRQLPFTSLKFNFQVEDAVRRGIRPDPPSGAPLAFVELMEACWHEHVSARPVIGEVVLQLQLMTRSRPPSALARPTSALSPFTDHGAGRDSPKSQLIEDL